ncbi:DUF4833 domain-containing protein [Dyadobacter sp. LHD-138]|uniref:DUF4833 domain-containing protein n=1 Tax=Dyadobacter sp. LHD-138 TaxID=3071413 RepID=UPI0027DF4160|nr:DUF4833 domain-containing protein [Dyadobacter sp. LHD-138]MDQ6482037.1 DUF4833 domain-containing protein [Dyadobacter sp. LHD-138]
MLIKFYTLLSVVVISYTTACAQKSPPPDGSWPVPDVPNLLFYIQRDPDINTVVYTLNTDDSGAINQKDPIKIFWIKYTEGATHKPLNILQKDLAYGLSVKPKGHEQYDVKAVAYPKMAMLLLKGKDNKYHISLSLNNRQCVLKRIFIRIVGGNHLHPDVAYLDFHGTELYTGKVVTERVFPD